MFSFDAVKADEVVAQAAQTPSLGVQVLLTLGPIAIIVGMWAWLMRRLGLNKNREFMEQNIRFIEQSRMAMEIAEAQNERIIAALERIEKALVETP